MASGRFRGSGNYALWREFLSCGLSSDEGRNCWGHLDLCFNNKAKPQKNGESQFHCAEVAERTRKGDWLIDEQMGHTNQQTEQRLTARHVILKHNKKWPWAKMYQLILLSHNTCRQVEHIIVIYTDFKE